MVIGVSEEESKQYQNELNKFHFDLDEHSKYAIKNLLEPYFKQLSCFHNWVDSKDYPNESDKTKMFCTHCNLKRDIEFDKYIEWLDEAIEYYNNWNAKNLEKNYFSKIKKQDLINLVSRTSGEFFCLNLFKNNVSPENFSKFCIYNYWKLGEPSNPKFKEIIKSFKHDFESQFLNDFVLKSNSIIE
jgi:transcription elongation factor Elf1